MWNDEKNGTYGTVLETEKEKLATEYKGAFTPAEELSQVSRCLSVNLRMLKDIQCLLRVQCEQPMYVSSAFKFASSCT